MGQENELPSISPSPYPREYVVVRSRDDLAQFLRAYKAVGGWHTVLPTLLLFVLAFNLFVFHSPLPNFGRNFGYYPTLIAFFLIQQFRYLAHYDKLKSLSCQQPTLLPIWLATLIPLYPTYAYWAWTKTIRNQLQLNYGLTPNFVSQYGKENINHAKTLLPIEVKK